MSDPKSSYLLMKTQSSYCPACNKKVYLLCEESGKKNPAFYICFDCKFIGELGKGRVVVKSD